MSIRHLVITIAAALGAAGCSKQLHVRSGTPWKGSASTVSGGQMALSDSIARGSITVFLVDSGSGNRDYEIGSSPFCWLFQKRVSAGALRVYVSDDFLGVGPNSHDESTVDSLGIVSGCL